MNLDFPKDKKYQIIYADPPWTFTAWNPKTAMGFVGNKYPLMNTEDICKLLVNNIADDNCVLFLWVTAPNLIEGIKVIEAWGFVYKTIGFVWIKTYKEPNSLFWGMGYYTRSNAELCLLAIKGKPLKRMTRSVHQIVKAEARGHSEKPPEVRNKIVRLMGDLPRIELFARHQVPGWDCWGDEKSKIELLF